jgi:hypothetical protein
MSTKFVPRGDSTFALAYVRVGDSSADEETQRRAIAAWAVREGVTIVASHVSKGPTSETEALIAAIDALPVLRAGWFVVASLDRLHPEWEHFAALFNSLAHEKGARLVSADGAFDPNPGQQCPICKIPVQPSSRYPQALCGLCLREAADEAGRLLHFHNVDMTGGFRATYSDTGEARDGHVCYVRGVRCWADEARFGGIVIEPR